MCFYSLVDLPGIKYMGFFNFYFISTIHIMYYSKLYNHNTESNKTQQNSFIFNIDLHIVLLLLWSRCIHAVLSLQWIFWMNIVIHGVIMMVIMVILLN